MTIHQQELDRALRITSIDRDANRLGYLSATQSHRARWRFLLIALVCFFFSVGMLVYLVFDWASMLSIAGPVVVFLLVLTGWLSARYTRAFIHASPNSSVVRVEGSVRRQKLFGRGGRCEFTLIVQSRQFIVERVLWDAVREGGTYRVYFIEIGHWFPARLVAIEEVRG